MDYALKLWRGKYAVTWSVDRCTKRVSLQTTDFDEAQRRFTDYLDGIEQVRNTVGEIVQFYIDDKKARGKASATIDAQNWKALGPVFGHMRPEHVNRENTRQYLKDRMAAGRKVNTVHRELAVLLAGLRFSDRNTPAIVELPRPAPPKDRWLTKAEYRILLDASKDNSTNHIHLFVLLAYATAGRASAVLELTWDRVDFDRGFINLRSPRLVAMKGRSIVPMGTTVKAALRRAKELAVSDYVIEWGGAAVKSVKNGFAKAVGRAGLDDITPHILRHSAAVHMAEGGTPMSEISQILGHNSTKTTERVYARFSPTYLKGAISTLAID